MHPSVENLRRESALEEIRSWNVWRSARWIESTDSTNLQLAREIRENLVELPTVLVATRQTGGKGRGGNRWFSPDGCLMFTMAFPWDIFRSAFLSLEIGVVIAKSLEPISRVRPQIKWPNDIFLDHQKVCGILIEIIQNSGPETDRNRPIAIVGVGLNCQVDFAQADLEVQRRATSLHSFGKSPFGSSESAEQSTAPESVLVRILHAWMQYTMDRPVDESGTGLQPAFLHKWRDWSLLDGKWVVVDNAVTPVESASKGEERRRVGSPGRVEGMCLGIDAAGALLIATSSGEVRSILAGSVVSFREA